MTSNDETAVRQVMDAWLAASNAGDTASLLTLMTDDVVFLTRDGDPFGKEVFAAAAQGQSDMEIDASGDVEEVRVSGDLAYTRTFLRVAVRTADGPEMKRSGHSMSVLRREADGRWRVARDANFVKAED